MYKRSFLSIFIALSGISACSTGTSADNSSTSIIQAETDFKPNAWQAVSDQAGKVRNGWVEQFNAPQLDKLVGEAQAQNRNLRSSAINVERSWLLARQAGATLSPQVNLTAGASSQGNFDGESSNDISVGAQASWEIDVWNRIRSGQQAAILSAEAAEADYMSAQLSIAAATARGYFSVINATQQVQISTDIVDALKETQRIVDVKYKNGMSSAQEVALAKANLANSNANLVNAKASKDIALRSLEVLLGRYPAADLSLGSNLPDKPTNPPAGIPSDLLERRPDLVAAERRIAASIQSVDQAKAARLPRISLTSSIGGASQGLSDILDPANIAWRSASNLLMPIIDGKTLEINEQLSKIDQKAAIETYANTALNAFSEVEQALADGETLKERRSFIEEASKSSDEALRLARIQYREGEVDLLSVLQLEQSAFAARSNLLNINLLELNQFVDLNLALGGYWKSAEQ